MSDIHVYLGADGAEIVSQTGGVLATLPGVNRHTVAAAVAEHNLRLGSTAHWFEWGDGRVRHALDPLT